MVLQGQDRGKGYIHTHTNTHLHTHTPFVQVGSWPWHTHTHTPPAPSTLSTRPAAPTCYACPVPRTKHSGERCYDPWELTWPDSSGGLRPELKVTWGAEPSPEAPNHRWGCVSHPHQNRRQQTGHPPPSTSALTHGLCPHNGKRPRLLFTSAPQSQNDAWHRASTQNIRMHEG